LKECEKAGIPVDQPYAVEKNLDDVLKKFKDYEAERGKLSFEMDGVVVRLNDLNQQRKLGFTARSPRWAIAYKFAAKQATTKVLNVEHSVGRTGVITPAANLEPVECGGVIISNATLHNYDEVNRLDVRIGDTVLIERAGEVIPKVVKVITSKRTGHEIRISPPSRCPSCGSLVSRIKEEVALRCLNLNCPMQVRRRMIHFASRNAMDIEGMGEAVVNQLVEAHIIKDVADIYSIKKDDLLKLELFKDKRAENLLKAIEKSKKQPLERFIYGLGIPNVGEKSATGLAERFHSIRALAEAPEEELTRVPDVGPVVASSIRQFFNLSHVRSTLKKLKNHNIDPKPETSQRPPKNSPFTGKTVVFTGALQKLTRAAGERLIRTAGGKAAGNVSKKTDFVVVGENPGSKVTKARDFGVPTLTEEAFLSMINKLS
jgi:DNA ligase (NAD+)